MARATESILPKLTFEEALEITKIHSVAGVLKEKEGFIKSRPFISPHYTISTAALIGGGKNPIPGEISLAHRGVLFLDELGEFKKYTLEMLRGPLEEGFVTISRVNQTVTYTSKFLLIASTNPCPCGFLGHPVRKCICSQSSIEKYRSKISGPLIDRIDIHVEVEPVKYNNLINYGIKENSEIIRKRVNTARLIQQNRLNKYGIFSNSELTQVLIDKYCKLDKKTKNLLEKAFNTFGLTARAYNKILKVARTIADLEQCTDIKENHIAEAIQYRSLDKKYGNNKV